MSRPTPTHATLEDWIAVEATPFSVGSPETADAAVDTVMASASDSLELLGFGEALHGGEDFLILRNRLFRRLVAAHGYSAIALECSFPRARVVDEYVAGRGPASYEAVQDTGFSHGFGRPEAGTLEALLTAVPGPALFIPTHRGHGLPASAISALPTRSGSARNPTYFPLTPGSLADFDWLAVLDSTAYNRGGPPLQPSTS